MKKNNICIWGICICLIISMLAGCGKEEYSSADKTDEIAIVNSERAREETEVENAQRMKRAAEIAKAKADAQKEKSDSELVMNENVGEVGVVSSNRSGVLIPTYIYFPENYNAEFTYPMVLMFAGFSADHDNGTRFNHIAEELNKEGIMVVMYDNPGYGISEEDNLAYTLTNIKNDAVDVIMYMYYNYNIGKVGAIGYDVGGRAIMELEVDEKCNFDQIELIAPFCDTEEFIHTCFDKATWENLKDKATLDGSVQYEKQKYSKEWFLDWEAKAQTLTDDFVKKNKGNRIMLIYSTDDEEVSYYTMTDLYKNLGAAAICVTYGGHDLGVRGYDSPDEVVRIVREQSALFMEGLKK